MTNRGNFFISIIILLLGGVFTYFFKHADFTRWIVLMCGLAFAIPAAINLANVFISGRGTDRTALWRIIEMVCGVGGLMLGLCIIFLPEVFRSLLFYPFGALLLFGGLFQEFQISHKYRIVDYPGWLHVVPVLLIAAGIVLLCVSALHELTNEPWMVLIVGISGLLFGINGIIITWEAHKLPKLVRESRKAAVKAEKAAEDARKAARQIEAGTAATKKVQEETESKATPE